MPAPLGCHGVAVTLSIRVRCPPLLRSTAPLTVIFMISSAANDKVQFVVSDPQWFIPCSIGRPHPDPDSVQHYAKLMEESLEARTRLTCMLAWKWPALMAAIVEYTKKTRQAQQRLAEVPGAHRPAAVPAAVPAVAGPAVPDAAPAQTGAAILDSPESITVSKIAPAPGLSLPPPEFILIPRIQWLEQRVQDLDQGLEQRVQDLEQELEQRVQDLEQGLHDVRRLHARMLLQDVLWGAGEPTGPPAASSNSGDACHPGAPEQ